MKTQRKSFNIVLLHNKDALVYVNDELVWSQNLHHSQGSSNQCGLGYNEMVIPVDVNFELYNTDVITIRVTSGINQNAEDEAFGFKNVEITPTSCLQGTCKNLFDNISTFWYVEKLVKKLTVIH